MGKNDLTAGMLMSQAVDGVRKIAFDWERAVVLLMEAGVSHDEAKSMLRDLLQTTTEHCPIRAARSILRRMEPPELDSADLARPRPLVAD